MSKHIHILPPTNFSDSLPLEEMPLRVTAYCRVSGSSKEQLASLENQITYYEKVIKSNPCWTFVNIYADVASGVRVDKRSAYKQMLQDAAKHKFDLIMVKSLSRFGRDTVEALEQIRRLKLMNIAIYSEAEQINTLEAPEYAVALWMGHVQEESRAKSENIKFGIRERMRQGKAVLNHSQFLGYTKGENGILVVVPEEAEIVRKIFDLYLQGNGVRKIKKNLDEHRIKTATGKTVWSTSTIDRMLSNEKYIGRLIMQKSYTPDFLTGKQEKNMGQIESYVVENAHEAIISNESFEAVQKRKGVRN